VLIVFRWQPVTPDTQVSGSRKTGPLKGSRKAASNESSSEDFSGFLEPDVLTSGGENNPIRDAGYAIAYLLERTVGP
jgi:hypothetical protein